MRKLPFDMTHHSGIESIRMADVTGDGIEELLVESDSGGAGVFSSELHVFTVISVGVQPIISEPTRMMDSMDGQVYEQIIDIRRSRSHKGSRICFRMRMHQEHGRWLPAPKQSVECYKRRTTDAFNSDWLEPLPGMDQRRQPR